MTTRAISQSHPCLKMVLLTFLILEYQLSDSTNTNSLFNFDVPYVLKAIQNLWWNQTWNQMKLTMDNPQSPCGKSDALVDLRRNLSGSVIDPKKLTCQLFLAIIITFINIHMQTLQPYIKLLNKCAYIIFVQHKNTHCADVGGMK